MNATYYLKILICRTSTDGADAQAMTFNLANIPNMRTIIKKPKQKNPKLKERNLKPMFNMQPNMLLKFKVLSLHLPYICTALLP